MIQGFDPRTGLAVGEPVAETTDAEVDAIVTAAAEATAAWGAGTARPGGRRRWRPWPAHWTSGPASWP